jgi:aminoglycoside phosphotransferase (APT) family kinase protein
VLVTAKDPPSASEVAAFLAAHHGEEISDLEPLQGGFWSAAFGYRVGDRDLVVRFGQVPEGFEMDRAAMAFDRPDVPVPSVLEIGEALGRSFAISVRHHGRFLEDVPPGDARAAGTALQALLAALRTIAAPPAAPSSWFPAGADPTTSTWRRWLVDALVDDPSHPTHGWRPRLAAHPVADRLFRACETRLRHLRDACPERRDLVHSDLLHQNVLLSPDASQVTAVFSWKCSVRGDFLWDVAWCTFWSAWHPGIAAAGVWERTLLAPDLTEADLVDAAARLSCYQLQIGAQHLGWNAWREDDATLHDVAVRTEEVLESS